MTGWRIGYSASHPEVAKAMANLQSHAASNPNSIAQAATVAALSGGKEEIAHIEFKKKKAICKIGHNEIVTLRVILEGVYKNGK